MSRFSIKILLGLAFLAIVAWMIIIPARPPVTFKEDTLYISSGTRMWPFHVEIAESAQQQRHGLMDREDMDENQGMLFVNDAPRVMQMWMKDTYIPLDMLFIDAQGNIVYIEKRTRPNSTDIITYPKPVKGLLEIPAGGARARNIRVGDRVMYPAFNHLSHRKR